MVEFTTWDILRNLLLAARWTVLLSLVAFVGGGIVGLLVGAVLKSRRPDVYQRVGKGADAEVSSRSGP